MPAIAADIAAATRDAAIATWSSATVAGRYPSARDGSVSPATGYFDAIASAQAIIDARGVLIGVERRRFAVNVNAVTWPDFSAGLPQARLIDTEHRVDRVCLAARFEIDLEAETSNLELFG